MMATDEAGSAIDPAHKDSDVELSGKPAENLTTLQTIRRRNRQMPLLSGLIPLTQAAFRCAPRGRA